MNEDIKKLDPYQQSALYAGTLIAVSPNKKHFVAAYNGLVDFYSMDKDYDLSPRQQKYYHYPSYVYLLYSSSSLVSAGNTTFSANTILVYNWDGIPVKRYELDNYLLSINIDKDHNLWGVDKDHTYLYKYALK